MTAQQLTILYVSSCGLCRRARVWLEGQPKSLNLRFVAAGSDEARRLYPSLDPAQTLRDITVVDDLGQVYQGAKAWVVCLWALPQYRSLALDLSSPEMLPLARRWFAWVSENRHQLGRLAS